MADSYIILPVDSSNTGKKARTITSTVGGNVVHTSVVTQAATDTAPTVTNVPANASSVTLMASNAARRGGCIYNDADTVLRVKLGIVASVTSFSVAIQPGGYYELPQPAYTGDIDGIWAGSPTGAARVTELL